MVQFWREKGIKIVLYLDDGLVISRNKVESLKDSKIVQESLKSAGFHINFEKSEFIPTKKIEWLGLYWNSEEFSISIPQRRISDVKDCIVRVISLLPYVTARQLAQVTGKIISLMPVMGNMCRLMTRYCYMTIVTRPSWDRKMVLNDYNILHELKFWQRNVDYLNLKRLCTRDSPNTLVYSDASDVAAAAFTLGGDERIFHRMWVRNEAIMSSTWRELKAVEEALISFAPAIRSQSLKWFTDSQCCAQIVSSGSMKKPLQDLAFKIFSTCLQNNISLDIQWISRDQNSKADYLSKIIDYEDWGVTKQFFDFINSMWGPHTIDRFASPLNAKLSRFNSMFWNPGCEAVDCFCQTWEGENNWLVPPIALVNRCIKFLVTRKACGTLIVPKWTSSSFWPLIFKTGSMTHSYVKDVLEFQNASSIFEQGSNKNTIFGSEKFYSSVLAVRLDARVASEGMYCSE